MIEFGEKLKRLREEKGMTQQTVADQLYVTRQAVSRWECGARYPDLLTTKKIAALLETSIDELVADEKVRRDIQKEPVFTTPMSNAVQIVLYFICAFAGLILLISSAYISYPWHGITGTDGQREIILYLSIMLKDVLYVGAMLAGAFLAIRNEISPKKIGIIMSIPYATETLNMLVSFCMSVSIGHVLIRVIQWCVVAIPFVEALIIYRFFVSKRAVSAIPIYLFALGEACLGVFRIVSIWEPMAKVEEMRPHITLFILIAIGSCAFGVLLSRQAYFLYKKRKALYTC